LPNLRFSDAVSSGVLGPTVIGATTTVLELATVLVLNTMLVLNTVLVITIVVAVPGVVGLLADLGDWHPTSTVAATNMIGMMLRIVEPS